MVENAGLPTHPPRKGNWSVAAPQQGRLGKRAAGGESHSEVECLLGAKAIVKPFRALVNRGSWGFYACYLHGFRPKIQATNHFQEEAVSGIKPFKLFRKFCWMHYVISMRRCREEAAR